MADPNIQYHFGDVNHPRSSENGSDHVFLFQVLKYHSLWRYAGKQVTYYGCYFQGICSVDRSLVERLEFCCSMAAESCNYHVWDSEVQAIVFDAASVSLQDSDDIWTCKHVLPRPLRREISRAIRPFLSGTGMIEDEDIARLDALVTREPENRLFTSLCAIAIAHTDPWATHHFLKVLLPRVASLPITERAYYKLHLQRLQAQDWFMPDDIPIVEAILGLDAV